MQRIDEEPQELLRVLLGRSGVHSVLVREGVLQLRRVDASLRPIPHLLDQLGVL